MNLNIANAGHNAIPIKYNDDGMEMLEVKRIPYGLLFDENMYMMKKVIKLKKVIKYYFIQME